MWRQGELTLEAPGSLSQPAEPGLPGADPLPRTKGPRCWGGDGTLTGLQSLGPVWLRKARTGCSLEPS